MSSPLPPSSQATIPFDYDEDQPYDADQLFENAAIIGPLPLIPESTIYYLVIDRPLTKTIDILGPFATRAGLIYRLTDYLTRHCPVGLALLNEIISSQVGMDNFLQIGMTVPGAEDRHIMDVSIQKEDNGTVKHELPGPVWTVICTEMEGSIDPEEGPIVRSREILSTFPHTEAGEREAKNLAREAVETKIASEEIPNAELVTSGLRGVNALYNVVGLGGGWSIEANLHSGVEIVPEGASDSNGVPMFNGAGILNSTMLLQQHI